MSEPAERSGLARDWEALLDQLPSGPGSAESFVPPRANRVTLWAELEDVRLAWDDLRRSPQAESLAERLFTTRWTYKDLIAHMASWAKESRRSVETAVAGRPFDYTIRFEPGVGPTAWNQIEVDRRRERSLSSMFRELDRETRRLQTLVLELPDAAFQPTRTFAWLFGDPPEPLRTDIADLILRRCGHDRYHLKWIHERLRQP